MSAEDLLLPVLILIGISALVITVVQLVRSARGRDTGGNWWEGPWDDDRKG